MPSPLRPFFAALIALFIAATVPSLPVTAQAQLRQVELSEDMVQRFLTSYPELRALGKKYKKERPKSSDSSNSPIAALSGYLEHKAERAYMEAVLAKHGFADFPESLDVARSVALAYGFVKSGKTPAQRGGQAEQALAAIRNNPRLSAGQKKQMEMMVSQQLSRLKQAEPSPHNIAVAKQMQAQIAAVMDSD